jgi:hypothetical protein
MTAKLLHVRLKHCQNRAALAKNRPQPSSNCFLAMLRSHSCRWLHPGAILLRLQNSCHRVLRA